jgi:hypothetical protein
MGGSSPPAESNDSFTELDIRHATKAGLVRLWYMREEDMVTFLLTTKLRFSLIADFRLLRLLLREFSEEAG